MIVIYWKIGTFSVILLREKNSKVEDSYKVIRESIKFILLINVYFIQHI